MKRLCLSSAFFTLALALAAWVAATAFFFLTVDVVFYPVFGALSGPLAASLTKGEAAAYSPTAEVQPTSRLRRPSTGPARVRPRLPDRRGWTAAQESIGLELRAQV